MMQNMPNRSALMNGNSNQTHNNPPPQQHNLNYCLLPTPEDAKKQEVNKLIAEYNQLHNRKHAIEARMKELGFRPEQ